MSQRPSTSKPRGVCTYFRSRRGCRNGDTCKFLHGEDDTLSPYDKSKVCRFYAAGFCKHGDKCWFQHTVNTTAVAASEAGASAGQRGEQDVNEEDENLLCSICQEKPVTYGLLEDCSHVFCLECIRGWRDPTGKSQDIVESGNTKRCPYCRASSKFVTPSSVFYSGGDDLKATTIASYKASMARVPCKYFEVSLPGARFCPFGRDCFYQHKEIDGTMYAFDRGADYYMTRPHPRDRWRNVSFSDIISNIRPVRTENDVLQTLAELRSRFESAHRSANERAHDGDYEDTFIGRLVEEVLMNLEDALIAVSGSSVDEHAEEGHSPPSRPSILATPEDSMSTSVLTLTRAFMDNNMPSDDVELLEDGSGSGDDFGEGSSTRVSLPPSHNRRHSLPNLTNAWTDELLSANDIGSDITDNVAQSNVDSPNDDVEQSSPGQLRPFTPHERQHQHVHANYDPEGTELLASYESSSTMHHTALNESLTLRSEESEASPLRTTEVASARDDRYTQDREQRSKPETRSELTSRRAKSSSSAVPCNGRRNGGQSFVTDGRGRVVATDDCAYTDGASLAFWTPATSIVASPLASTGETSARASDELGALDDLD